MSLKEVQYMKVLLIIPAYNEEESILSTIEAVKEYQKIFPYQLDYIVINDGSVDDTEVILKKEEAPKRLY